MQTFGKTKVVLLLVTLTAAGQGQERAGQRSVLQQPPTAQFVKPLPLSRSTQVVLAKPRTLSFQSVTPGITTSAELLKARGEPTKRLRRKRGGQLWQYSIKPFDRVDMVVEKDVVRTIIVRLKTPLSVEQASTQLKVGKLRSVEIWNKARNKLLGSAYPDRGILFRFGQGDGRVTQIVVEPLSVEPFLLRVHQDSRHRYSQNLADLGNAAQLQPDRASIHLWKARILVRVGRFGEADQAVVKAIQFSQGEPQLAARVLHAETLFKLDEVDEARQEIRLAVQSERPLTISRAYLIEGQLILGTSADPQAALKAFQNAIRVAAPLAKSTQDARQSSEALRLLMEAHFEIASLIAVGRWKHRKASSLGWAGNATTLSERLFERTGDKVVRLRASVKLLEVYSKLKATDLDPSVPIRLATDLGRQLGGESKDPLFRQQLAWYLANALGHAGAIERTRGRHERATQYLTNSIALREALQSNRPTSVEDRYVRGVECFYLGSLYAKSRNFREARLWFNQARIQLPKTIPKSLQSQLRFHGDRLVAMGVTYWQAGEKTLGISLTREGIEQIEKAVKKKLATPQALIIPYGNLAGMVRQKGDTVEADSLRERAATIQKLLK